MQRDARARLRNPHHGMVEPSEDHEVAPSRTTGRTRVRSRGSTDAGSCGTRRRVRRRGDGGTTKVPDEALLALLQSDDEDDSGAPAVTVAPSPPPRSCSHASSSSSSSAIPSHRVDGRALNREWCDLQDMDEDAHGNGAIADGPGHPGGPLNTSMLALCSPSSSSSLSSSSPAACAMGVASASAVASSGYPSPSSLSTFFRRAATTLPSDSDDVILLSSPPSTAATSSPSRVRDALILEPLEEGAREIVIPRRLAGKLWDYQRDGVHFLWRRFISGTGAILADDMGMGKTLQVIVFLTAIVKAQPKAKIIVVAPSSLLGNWAAEVEKWNRRLRYKTYVGPNRQRALNSMRRHQINIMFTSYSTYAKSKEDLKELDPDVVVCDEAHKIKNYKSKTSMAMNEISTQLRYGLTGTVMQNTLDEFYTLVSWADPHCLGGREQFDLSFAEPIRTGHRIDASRADVARYRRAALRLSRLIKDKVVLRRDKSLIADRLPSKRDMIVFCPMVDLQRQIYKRVLAFPEFAPMRPCDCGNPGVSRMRCCYSDEQLGRAAFSGIVFRSMELMRKIAAHPALLLPTTKHEGTARDTMLHNAKRAFGEDGAVVRAAMAEDRHYQLSGKMEFVRKLVPLWQAEGSKVVIFSQRTVTLNFLESMMYEMDVSFLRMDGNTRPCDRLALAEQFNTGTHTVFLVSTKVGGLGLNLIGATVAVVFDPSWNQSWDLQAQDRIFRLGQTKDCVILRLISCGTIEENVYHRQLYKQQSERIALHANHQERRFRGMPGVRGQEGDLWGMANLLCFNEARDETITNELMKKNKEDFHGFKAAETTGSEGAEGEGLTMGDILGGAAALPCVPPQTSGQGTEGSGAMVETAVAPEDRSESWFAAGAVHAFNNEAMLREDVAEAQLLDRAEATAPGEPSAAVVALSAMVSAMVSRTATPSHSLVHRGTSSVAPLPSSPSSPMTSSSPLVSPMRGRGDFTSAYDGAPYADAVPLTAAPPPSWSSTAPAELQPSPSVQSVATPLCSDVIDLTCDE